MPADVESSLNNQGKIAGAQAVSSEALTTMPFPEKIAENIGPMRLWAG